MATQHILQTMLVEDLCEFGWDEQLVLNADGEIVSPPWLREDKALVALLATERAMALNALKMIRES